jgi:hypothetical protein
MFHIPYVASLSDFLRLATLMTGASETIQAHIESIIEDIHNNLPVAASLKVPVEGCKIVRQVDIRRGERPKEGEPKAEIVMKAFITWDHDKELWHVFVEWATEDFWEQRLRPEKEDGSEASTGPDESESSRT